MKEVEELKMQIQAQQGALVAMHALLLAMMETHFAPHLLSGAFEALMENASAQQLASANADAVLGATQHHADQYRLRFRVIAEARAAEGTPPP